MSETLYAISIYEPATGLSYHENSQVPLETMSGIKSVIGTLALEQAAVDAHDIDTFCIGVTMDHYSNGSGDLKYALQLDEAPLTISIRELVTLNTAQSDCVATNALIEYLGEKDNVNSAICNTFGLPSMHLATERIAFPGVDHVAQPFQVGSATMAEFTAYYGQIWAPSSDWSPYSPAHSWHQLQHRMVPNARLFGVSQAELPVDLEWLHKTGSAEDTQGTDSYKTFMDAGMLRIAGRELFIAAAETTHREGTRTIDAISIEQVFAARNMLNLATLGVEIDLADTLSSVA